MHYIFRVTYDVKFLTPKSIVFTIWVLGGPESGLDTITVDTVTVDRPPLHWRADISRLEIDSIRGMQHPAVSWGHNFAYFISEVSESPHLTFKPSLWSIASYEAIYTSSAFWINLHPPVWVWVRVTAIKTDLSPSLSHFVSLFLRAWNGTSFVCKWFFLDFNVR